MKHGSLFKVTAKNLQTTFYEVEHVATTRPDLVLTTEIGFKVLQRIFLVLAKPADHAFTTRRFH
jgi:hypothetical protein